MKTTRSFLLLLMLLATSGLNAQKEEDKYAALVSEVRNEVWSLNLPDFKNMTVPEKYRNEPAVILAAHSRLEVTRKTKLDWWGMGLTKQQITCRSIYRQMVYITAKGHWKRCHSSASFPRKKNATPAMNNSVYWV